MSGSARPASSSQFGDKNIDASTWLSHHGDDPLQALYALVAHHNELMHQHAILSGEKQAADKAVERLGAENQALWKSLRPQTRPSPARQEPSGVGKEVRDRERELSAGGRGTPPFLDASALRRALSTDGPAAPRTDGFYTGASTPTLPHPDEAASLALRGKSATPPPPASPRRHSSASSNVRKTSSLDLGRGYRPDQLDSPEQPELPASAADLVRQIRTPPQTRAGQEGRDRGISPRLPGSASMPSFADANQNGRTPERRLLSPIAPVSPFYSSNSLKNREDSPQYASEQQLLPPPPMDSRRDRDRTTSSNSAVSSLGSAFDERTFASTPSASGRSTSSFAPPSPLGKMDEGDERRLLQSQLSKTAPAHASTFNSSRRGSEGADSRSSAHSPKESQVASDSGITPAPPPRPTPTQRPPSPARPTLTPAFLPFTRVRVGSSNIKTNDRGKEIVTFVVDVTVTIPPEVDPGGKGGLAGWRIEKLYSDVLTLDSAVKAKNSKQESKGVGSLPDKSLFKDHAPHKSDQRKAVLEKYLQILISIPLRDRAAVCAFLSSDVVAETAPAPQTGTMEGWLTKRGRNFGGWQTRYYVLSPGQSLAYYGSQNGPKLGEIPLVNAAIGRQSSKTNEGGDDAYLHAFLIRTLNDKDQDADHILCAENDEMRDVWVQALTTMQPPKANGQSTATATERERTPSAQDTAPAPPTISTTSPEGRRPSQQLRRQSGTVNFAAVPISDARHLQQRAAGSDMAPSASMPADLDAAARGGYANDPIKRSTSAQGQHAEPRTPSKLQSSDSRRPSVLGDRAASPERERAGRHDATSNTSKFVASNVSGPMNAQPLPSGYDFKRADRSKKTKSSFWNFGARANEKSSGTPPMAAPARPVFGVPLKEAVAISRIRPGLELPAVVYRCVEYLEAKNAECEEGIFRLSGSANVIRLLKDRFNAEGDINLLHSNEYYDPHAIAGLLKSFLRELPSHLLTRELHAEFIQVIDLRNRKDRVNALGRLVARLPIEEYTLMRFFFAHLCVIAQNAEISKMNLRNLGIVFSPTLAIPAPLFTLLLAEFDLVFAVEQETGLSRPIMVEDEEEADAAQARRRANRNSELYSASGAAQLMESEAMRASLREQIEDDSEGSVAGDEDVGAAERDTRHLSPHQFTSSSAA